MLLNLKHAFSCSLLDRSQLASEGDRRFPAWLLPLDDLNEARPQNLFFFFELTKPEADRGFRGTLITKAFVKRLKTLLVRKLFPKIVEHPWSECKSGHFHD